MSLFLQGLAMAVAIGGVYALMAIGLNLIFGVMRVVNFAHGALYMIGGYAAFVAVSMLGAPLPLAIVMSATVAGVVGYGINAILLRPVYRSRMDRPMEYTLIITFAFSLMAVAAATAIFRPQYRRIPGFWSQNIQLADGVSLSGDRIVAFVVACLLVGLLIWVIRHTDVGRGWRALTQNRLGAEVVGVDVFRLSNLAFAMSGALAGAAGGLLVPLYLAYPTMGDGVVVKSFVIVVMGGLGSIMGCLVGGLLLAAAEVFGSIYFSSAYADVYGLVLMLVFLLVRPQGLFGQKLREV